MRLASLVVAGFLFPVVPVAAQDRDTTSAGSSQQDSQGQQPPYVPGVRPSGVNIGDAIKIGGYGSVRYETNSLTAPKPAGFEFRRFVLTTDATPSDRLRAYVEIEFERLGEIEVERQVQRTADGIKSVPETQPVDGWR